MTPKLMYKSFGFHLSILIPLGENLKPVLSEVEVSKIQNAMEEVVWN